MYKFRFGFCKDRFIGESDQTIQYIIPTLTRVKEDTKNIYVDIIVELVINNDLAEREVELIRKYIL